MTEKEEKELIRNIVNNESAAIENFYQHFQGRVYRIVLHKLGKSAEKIEDSKDLTSEILWHTILSIREEKYHFEKGRLTSYMYGIINNHCKNYFKGKKKDREKFDRADFNSTEAKMEKALEIKASLSRYGQERQKEMDVEIQNILTAAIESLDEKYRKLIYQKYYKSFSYDEISEMENLPLSKVKSRLYEARKILEKSISKTLRTFSNFLL